MAESVALQNPYHADRPASELFLGRGDILGALERAFTTGRQAIAAVTGGRGMGKSSLTRKLEAILAEHPDVFTIRIDRPATTPGGFARALASALGREIDPDEPAASLFEIVRQRSAPRVVLVIDEVEHLLTPGFGPALLDELRIKQQDANGRLGIVVLGGSMLRQLLISGSSPFLRAAQWRALRGLTRGECEALMSKPLRLDLDPAVCDLVWHDTNGHPLLIQRTMERAVERWREQGATPEATIRDILTERAAESLDQTLFGLWWENLTPRGQQLFRRLLEQGAPLPEADALAVLGERWPEWLEVLETTGVACREHGLIAPRGELFRRWFTANLGGSARRPPEVGVQALWDRVAVPEFERTVVLAISRWARTVLEFSGYHLRADESGNHRLQKEDHFQLSLLGALRQQPGWTVEGEALSVRRGARSDIKIRNGPDGERACGELKRWLCGDPKQYKGMVNQALKYAAPTDTFAFTVALDCGREPFLPRFLEDCNLTATPTLYRSDERQLPALLTEHARPPDPPLRVYHFLLQLPA